MPRSMRIEYPGAIYHITIRGNAKGNIFYSDNDKKYFLVILANVIDHYKWVCYSYCLMHNHYHLLIKTQEANLACGMRYLNGVYAMKFNKIYNRVGHLFQGRYKSILVSHDSYLLELCRYIVLNPVRANIVSKPEDYAWSSYGAIIAWQSCPSFLTTNWILAQFSDRPDVARKQYIEFVCMGIKNR